MNCQNRILLLLLLCAVHAVTAFQSTSESVNPFNEYYSANASVNEYTGTAAASLPLGKVGSADIMLKYSSNVTTNARANNKIAPTGSVGLGWQLGFGSVVCDHKNTYTIDDDDYFFINSNGATKKILTAQKLNYKYYDLSSYSWSALPELSTFTATDSGTTENFTLNLHDQITNFGYIFSGEIYVPADGSYTFGVRCDDGVRLYIDGTSVFETSLYAVQSVTANPIVKTLNGLTKGYHTIKVEYFQRTSTYSLELYFYPADGTSQRLTTSVLSHPGSAGEGRRLYFLEDDPYVKIERVEDQGICTGWIFTEPNGKKYRYGSLSFTNTRLATRNIFANSATGYVGNVLSGTPTAYPYQWDLSQIEETDGLMTDFYYTKEADLIHSGSFTSPISYTRASYIDSIVSSAGANVKFVYETKADDTLTEYYDPNNYEAEPDGCMEFYGKKRLSSVNFYLPTAHTPYKTFNLSYKFLNADLVLDTSVNKNEFLKSLLIALKEYRGSELFQSTIMKYDDNSAHADQYEENCNYGALQSIKNDEGTSVSYNYKLHIERSNAVVHKLMTKSETIEESGGFWGDLGVSISSGTYDNGKEFIAVRSVFESTSYLSLYTYNGHEWVIEEVLNGKNLYDPAAAVYASDNVLVITKAEKNKPIDVYTWSNGRWYYQCINILAEGGGESIDQVHLGNDFMVLRGGDGSNNNDRVWVYILSGNLWKLSTLNGADFRNNNLGDNAKEKTISVGNNFFVVKPDVNSALCNRVYALNWDGTQWVKTTLQSPSGAGLYFKHVYAGPNYIVCTGGNAGDYDYDCVWVYTFNGTEWVASPNFNGTGGIRLEGIKENKIIKTMPDYFVVSDIGYYNDWIATWTGADWAIQKIEKKTGTYAFSEVYPGNNFIVVKINDNTSEDPDNPNASMLRVYDRKNNGWVVNSSFADVSQNQGIDFTVYPLNNAFVVAHSGLCFDLYSFDGINWKKEYKHGLVQSTQMVCYGIKNGLTLISYGEASETAPGLVSAIDILMLHKFQESYAEVKNYVVDSTVEKTYPQLLESTTAYNYFNNHFDTYYGIPRFNRVESVKNDVDKNGKIVNYYYNDSHADNQHLLRNDTLTYKELDGYCYRSIKSSIRNGVAYPIVSDSLYYDVFSKTHWPASIFHKLLRRSVNVAYNVKTESINFYDTINGSIYCNWNVVGDTVWTTSTYFAFHNSVYASTMSPENRYMLTQPSEIDIYRQVGSGGGSVISRKAFTWQKDAFQRMLPYQTYVLNVPMNGEGIAAPSEHVHEFSHASGAVNTYWQLTNTIDRVNTIGQVVQTANPKDIKSITIYRGDNYLPAASIANANFEEAGVLTCDYDVNANDGYFDNVNGWENNRYSDNTLGESDTSNDAKHFGVKGIKVRDAYGPTRNFKLVKGKDYILSAWIKSASGAVPMLKDIVMGVDYRKRLDASGTEFPIVLAASEYGTSGDIKVKEYGDWNYVELEVPASKDISEDNWSNNLIQYARVWVGAPNGNGTSSGTVYIDDIRFYPKDALVTSTYYEDKFTAPILSVDANNLPGLKNTYDDFGRIQKVDKIDVTKATAAANYATTIAKKEYHKRNELFDNENIKLLSPVGDESVWEFSSITIEWVNRSSGNVTIYYENEDGSEKTTIATLSCSAGYNSYNWTVPNLGTCSKKIRVTIGSFESVSEKTFTITNVVYGTNRPVLVYPASGATGIDCAGTVLSWNVSNASIQLGSEYTYYKVYLGLNDGINAVSYDQVWDSIRSTSFTIPITLKRGEVYEWYVEAHQIVDGLDISSESVKRTFTTYTTKYSVSIVVCSGAVVEGSYNEGDLVQFSFDESSYSDACGDSWWASFVRWKVTKGGSINIVADSYHSISFTMPARNVAIVAE